MKRRRILQLLFSCGATLAARINVRVASVQALHPIDVERLNALAEVVLPGELGAAGRARAVQRFLGWVREYRAGAETDHGYGLPRLRRTAPSPALRYPAQLDALEAEARKQGRAFGELPVDSRRALVEHAISTTQIERLPGRPDGGHIATDLLGFFLNSVEANDLCYRARIGRDTCRDLAGSENRPDAIPTGGR